MLIALSLFDDPAHLPVFCFVGSGVRLVRGVREGQKNEKDYISIVVVGGPE
jgi:hypothetical protein